MADPARIQQAKELLRQRQADPNRVQSAREALRAQYGALQQPAEEPTPEKDGFFKSIIKDPVKTLIVKPGVRMAQAGIAIFGGEQGKRFAEKDINVRLPLLGNFNIEAQKTGAEGVKQITGDALKTTSYLYTPTKVAGITKNTALGSLLQGAQSGLVGGASYNAGDALQQNKSLKDVAVDATVGGVAGGVTGGVLGVSGNLLGKGVKQANTFLRRNQPDEIVNRRVEELTKLENSYATVRNRVGNAKTKNIDVKRVLAETDLLAGSVDENGIIRTENAITQLNDFIKPQENVVRRSLEKEGRKIPLKMVDNYLKGAVNKSGVKGGAKLRALKNVADDMAGYALDADKDGYVPLTLLHDAKVDKYANINYLNPESKRVDKAIAKGLKELVEKNSKSVPVEGLNKELEKYFTLQDFLETLDGKKVSGGKLGKYFAQTIGSIAGSHFGPLGTIVGAEVGGAVQGSKLASTFGGSVGQKLKQSPLMEKMVENAKDKVIYLPQSNNLGNRKINQSKTMIPTKNNIDKSKIINQIKEGLNESTPGLYTNSRYTITYTNKKGEKVVLRDMDRNEARGWAQYLEEKGIKFATKVAGTGATASAIAYGAKSNTSEKPSPRLPMPRK